MYLRVDRLACRTVSERSTERFIPVERILYRAWPVLVCETRGGCIGHAQRSRNRPLRTNEPARIQPKQQPQAGDVEHRWRQQRHDDWQQDSARLLIHAGMLPQPDLPLPANGVETQASRLTSFGRGDESMHSITRFSVSGDRQRACMTRWASSWDRSSLNRIRLVPSLSSSTTRYIANGSKRRKQASAWHTYSYGQFHCGIPAGPVAIRISECCRLTDKIGQRGVEAPHCPNFIEHGSRFRESLLNYRQCDASRPDTLVANPYRGERGRRCDQAGRIRHGH